MSICHLHYCDSEHCAERHGVEPGAPSASLGLGLGLSAPAVITFKPAVFEHMYHPWETPRVIDNPRELREECNKRGVTSEYLRDSGIWRSGPNRWV